MEGEGGWWTRESGVKDTDAVSGDLEELGEEVDVSPGGGGEHRHGTPKKRPGELKNR